MAKDNDFCNSVLNLTALQRLDNSITSIIESANQVCIYRFLHESDDWKKTEVEGTLFVYLRSKKPQHGFIVMNRINTTNWIEPITSDFEFQVQKPFILYRNIQGEILSIWFYQGDNLLKISRVFSGLAHLPMAKKEKSSIKTATSSGDEKKQKKSSNQLNNTDIMSLLSRAQEEYDMKLSSQSPSKLKTDDCSSCQILKPTPVRATNGVVLSDNMSVSLTVDSLFAQVGDGKHVFNGDASHSDKLSRSKSLSEAGKALGTENNESILQKLLSTKSNQMEKKIENGIKVLPGKAIRARSATISSRLEQQASVEMVEKDLKEKLHIFPTGDRTIDESPKTVKDSSSFSYAPSKPVKVSNTKTEEMSILTPAMLSSSLPNNYPSPFKHHQGISENENDFSLSPTTFPVPPSLKKHSPVQLLSPMDFANSVPTSRSKLLCSPPKFNASPKPSNSLYIDGSLMDNVLLPSSLIESSTPTSVSKSLSVTPLTKAQLREALIYMCQHDDEFITQLHECYLKSLKCRLNHFKSS